MRDPITLIPGEWYIILACSQCAHEHIFADADNGQWIAGRETPCPNCEALMKHDDKKTLRYKAMPPDDELDV